MTRDEARKAAAVMLAYAEGKAIQYKLIGVNYWADHTAMLQTFNWCNFNYRIKPEVVRYRRYLHRDVDGELSVQCTHSEDNQYAVTVRIGFVRFIDTEWQEAEV